MYIIFIRLDMKQFRKNEQQLFICEECGKLCKDKTVLSIHNKKVHKLTPKEYFDKWIKEEGEGVCKICGAQTSLIRSDTGYSNCCSKKCHDTYVYKQTKKGNLKLYGVENPYQRSDIKKKIKLIKKKKYGNEKYQNRDQIKKKLI